MPPPKLDWVTDQGTAGEDEKRLKFGSDFGPTDFCAGPPGRAKENRARDIAIVYAPQAGENGTKLDLIGLPRFDRSRPADPPEPPESVDLGRDLRIVKLDREEAERIISACSPRGHYFVPVRQGGQAYSFEWTVPDEIWQGPRHYAWDPHQIVQSAIALSRLVLDNGYSTDYAARVFDYDNGEQQVVPLVVPSRTYRIRRTRDWLTTEEASELKELLAAYWAIEDELPGRIRRALWSADFATGVSHLSVMVPLIVVGLEALSNTSNEQPTKQFCNRIPEMAAAAGFEGMSKRLANWAYAARSRWAHGEDIALFPTGREQEEEDGRGDASEPGAHSEAQKKTLVKLETVRDSLRAIVRKAIEDETFRAGFTDDAELRRRWPVQGTMTDDDGTTEEIWL
jgi:hypothetical protein